MKEKEILPKANFPKAFSGKPFKKTEQTKKVSEPARFRNRKKRQSASKICEARKALLCLGLAKNASQGKRLRANRRTFPKAFSRGKRLLPGFFAKGLALWVEADRALVIADLHLGIEEMFNRQGVMLPRFNFAEIKKHLEKNVFPGTKPELIVINGDLKHEFGIVSEQEWSEAIDMLRFLQKHCKKLVLVRGNHDSILGPIAKWEGMSIENDGVLLPKSLAFVTHGQKMPKGREFEKAKVVVIGHDHPAITIRDNYKKEQFKCFLAGKFGKKGLVAMPSMSAASIGTDVRRQQLLSPFLQRDLAGFKVFAIADKVYDFGKLGGLD